MNILIDIGHPAHVHMFSPFAKEMKVRGHNVLFTCREKEFEVELLKAHGFEYISFGRKSSSLVGKALDLLRFDFKEWQVARRFRPDVFLSHGSIVASHAAWLCHKPNIAFEDTFNMEQVRLYAPFTKVIITSDYDHPLRSWKNVVSWPFYNELLYLHPNRFTPDPRIRKALGLNENEPYTIIRFVGWQATHDKGHTGISAINKIKAVRAFEQFGRVFISSETRLPKELEPYRFPLLPNNMHDAEAFASLVFGESPTMISEASALGTPGVLINSRMILCTRDIESKYHLCYNFTESEEDQLRAIDKGVEILSGKTGIDYQQQRQLLLNDKIDVTARLIEFVESHFLHA